MRRFIFVAAVASLVQISGLALAAGRAEHVILIVWDGMRPDFISQEHTPTLYRLAHEGVMFQNHHAVFCSATEVNGTALATGCYPEHSGIVANRDYFPEINPLMPVDVQSTSAIRRGDQLSGGHYLLRPTLEEILQAAGKTTVVAGSKPVVLLHDRRERPDDARNVILYEGKILPQSALSPIQNLLGRFPPDVGGARTPLPNDPRNEWTTRALIGPLWSNAVPAFSLLWLNEPDYSQHATGPGSPKSLAALKSNDGKLAAVLAELNRRGLRDKTDIFIVSDHGFSTVSKEVNVLKAFRDAGFAVYRQFTSQPTNGNILLVNEGGSELLYVIGHDTEAIRRLVNFLQQQEFTGVILSREPMEGSFPLADARINSPKAPDVVFSMRWSSEKSKTGAPGMFVSDLGRRPGEGSHASLSRFDMHNTLVASGPDLKKSFTDTLPSGNTDLAPTILWLLGVKPPEPMDGRVLSEALTVDAPPVGEPVTKRIQARAANDHFTWQQYLQTSQVNGTIYLDEGNGSQIAKEASATN